MKFVPAPSAVPMGGVEAGAPAIPEAGKQSASSESEPSTWGRIVGVLRLGPKSGHKSDPTPAGESTSKSLPVIKDQLTHNGRWDYMEILKWLLALLPIYLGLRILVFSNFDPSIALEVVRQQGLKGMAEAAVISVYRQILVTALLLGFLALRFRGALIPYNWTLYSTLAVGGVAVILAPIPLIIFVSIAGISLLVAARLKTISVSEGVPGSRYRRLVNLGASALLGLSTILLVACLVTEPWIPHERVWSAEHPKSKLATSPPELSAQDGYVLGRASGLFYSILVRRQDGDRLSNQSVSPQGPTGVLLLPDIKVRVVCSPAPNILNPATWQSIANLLLGVTGECQNYQLGDGKTPQYVRTPSPSPGPAGSRGPPGPQGPRGEQGPPGNSWTPSACPGAFDVQAGC